MHGEAVQLSADWLAGTLTDFSNRNRGINTFLAVVPVAPDPRPANIAVVEDETRHPNVARDEPTSQSPGVLVRLQRPVEVEAVPKTIVTDGLVDLVVEVCLKNVTTDDALRDGLFYGRALVGSLRDFARNENIAKRSLRSIQLIQLMMVQHQPVFVELRDTLVTAAVFVQWKCRDNLPFCGVAP